MVVRKCGIVQIQAMKHILFDPSHDFINVDRKRILRSSRILFFHIEELDWWGLGELQADILLARIIGLEFRSQR